LIKRRLGLNSSRSFTIQHLFDGTANRGNTVTQKLSYERYVWFHGMVGADAFPNAAKLAEQEWYEAQEVSTEPDGSLRLRFPVSGFAEVIREILKYGADVEVVEPARLRAMVKAEIRRMGKLYR